MEQLNILLYDSVSRIIGDTNVINYYFTVNKKVITAVIYVNSANENIDYHALLKEACENACRCYLVDVK